MIDLDVLVIGGGAQGLWLLNDLSKRQYRTVLLERGELGGGQTCHSHGLIHRGHYYDDTDMMIILNAAAQFWEAFVDEKGIAKLNKSRALAGFGPGTAVQRHTYFWSTAGLNFDECPEWPEALLGGKVKHLFETDEFSLDASEVVKGLSRDVDHATYKLDEGDDAIRFIHDGKSISSVEASLSGTQVELRPKFVVIAAGIGNCGLLGRIGANRNPSAGETFVQAQRKNQMMVLRGDHLPLMTAVFPIRGGLQGVFLCSREDPETGRPVWLVSDHNSVPFPMGSDGTPQTSAFPSQEWVKRMLISLSSVAPGLFVDDDSSKLEVSVYTGLTSERSFGVGQHMTDMYIDPLGFDNVLTVWPTKLTMTPFASNVVMRFIRPKVPEPAGGWPRVEREITARAPLVANEMWQRTRVSTPYEVKTPWLPFRHFLEEWRAEKEIG
ncbi:MULTISPECIES: FAD-dependent oxidoreductase [Pseudofrankia]|uniref:FAD-dependent oxidoreductase n=1 Tax=Pseudofrankia TaxID=2994363 RepID=UPI000234CB84|nr:MULTISPECIES: FAD-dependent oxidoreductase [Pseudofrankia]OHV37007.1 hypothetical protein BCD49_17330 [Pseudofrankia sp. EUN1h]